ncbi:carbon storage regulator, CsrA [Caloramator quimbayensis]|uniref:Translational regulator CsrA n=1 Tax=Caloramator quimbayensis TaxID=1147123 RepID=A0A1T4XAN6_9CLOT|nr:carbon storage regulator [Caloramator quimbayensis]SKA86168.1 carbon storage regulator, CsrA [Caloramator quimbayensis]
MLVIGRKIGESFLIGENIEVCILEVDNGVVKVGINAPKAIKIVRKELLAEVKNQNIESAKNIESIIKKIK